jgi:hypothetical protein
VTHYHSIIRGARSSRPPFLASRREFPTCFLSFVLTALLIISASAQVQQAWVARYNNGIANGTNQAVKMALDGAGNIYVIGVSQNTNTNLGYVTIKYAPNGNQLWVARFDSTNYPAAQPAAMAIDVSNNIVVTGNALTIKYDSNGNQLWTAPYPGSSVAVSTNGYIAITGFNTAFSTVEFNSAGAPLWQQTYPSPCEVAAAQAIVIDSSGDVYVAGSYSPDCYEGVVVYELLIVKYNANGTEVWTTSYQNSGNQWRTAGEICDNGGNFYLSGN